MFFVAIGLILLAECCLRFLVKRFLSFRGERLCSLLESSMLSYEMNQVNICGAVALKSRVSHEAVRRASEKLGRSRFARTVFQGKIVRVRDSPVAPVVTIEDGEDLEHVMEREINTPFDETACPFRTLVLCGAERDCLIVVGRHVNFDGLSALELLRRLLILVKDPDAVFPDSNIANCDEFVLLKGYMPLLVQLILVVVEAARELLFFRLRSRSSRPTGAVSAVSLGKGCVPNARSNQHCQFVSKTLSESETAQIIDAARSRAVTVGNAVLAAAMQARCEGDDVWASLQADFRRMTAASSSSQGFLFGNLTPVISLSRKFAFLKGTDVWDLAKDCQSELRGWNSVRTTSTYYLYYGLLSQLLLPIVGRFVALRHQQTPINVPLITMSNIGVIASSINSSRPPLWSLEDLKRMPELEHFLGAVSEPVVFRHYICGSYLFLGKLTLTANYSRFAITREEAKNFLEKIAKSLVKGGK